MPRALKTPKFGSWLRKQRGDKTLGEFAIQVRRYAAPLGLELDRSQIVKLEAGRMPSVPILMAVADALDMSVGGLQARIAAELRGEIFRDLIRHDEEQDSDLSRRSDVSASAAQARIQQLEQQLKERDRFIAETQEAALRLVRLYATSPEDLGTPASKSRRRGSGRKAG